jgi:hypothetical protein
LIELDMVRQMARRGAGLAPLLIGATWIAGGRQAALSAAVGMAMALANLWLAGRVIGGVADNSPDLLMGAGMLAFGGGLGVLTAVAFALQRTDLVTFAVTGFALIGTHLGLVAWEAARAFPVAGRTTTGTGS